MRRSLKWLTSAWSGICLRSCRSWKRPSELFVLHTQGHHLWCPCQTYDRWSLMSRIIRFLLSGGSAAATEYIAFIALLSTLSSQSIIITQSLSFACGFVVSFKLNRSWVFRSEGHWSSELIRYGILAAINLVIGNALMLLMANHIHVYLAKFLVMGIIATSNYAIFSRLIFKPAPRT